MHEMMFVLKSLLASVLVLFCLQFRVGSTTLENHAHRWMAQSAVPQYLQKVSAGAILMLRQGSKTVREFAADQMGGGEAPVQRAENMSLGWRRSQQYLKDHPESGD